MQLIENRIVGQSWRENNKFFRVVRSTSIENAILILAGIREECENAIDNLTHDVGNDYANGFEAGQKEMARNILALLDTGTK